MPDIEGQVTRREILKKGVLGAAGLTVLPAIVAACGGSSATPTAAPVATPATPTGPVITPRTDHAELRRPHPHHLGL